jgi:hypothetical protein
MRWVCLVIEHYFAWTGKMVDKNKLLHVRLPDELWTRIENFLVNLSKLPCWIDKQFSTTVFGPKQNLDYWETVFKTGKAPNGLQILTEPLDLNRMIHPPDGNGDKI